LTGSRPSSTITSGHFKKGEIPLAVHAERTEAPRLTLLRGGPPLFASWILAVSLSASLAWALPVASESRQLAGEAAKLEAQASTASDRVARLEAQVRDAEAALLSLKAEVEDSRRSARGATRTRAGLAARIEELQAKVAELEAAAAAAAAGGGATGGTTSVQPLPPVVHCYYHLIKGRISEEY
jgi:hypothetical protein